MCVCLVCDDVAVTPSITCRILERMTCVRVIPVLEERGVPIKQREVDHEGIGLGAPQSFARADRFAVALSAYDAYIAHGNRLGDVVFVDTPRHRTHSVMLRMQVHSDSHARSLHHGAPRREGRSMDRMFVEAASAVTASPERRGTGDRSRFETLCVACRGTPCLTVRFPAAQAARWRRRGDPVQRGKASRPMASSGRSSCT